jgi:hypothetical protein
LHSLEEKVMKKIQTLLAVVAMLASSVSAHAALEATFFAAGSSAQFNIFGVAASTGSSPLCGTNHWTQKNAVTLVDPRSSSILPETGNIWIVWNSQAASGASGGIVCYYVSVDSIVGMRTYFANATVNLPSSEVGVADGAVVPYMGGTAVALPAAIQTLVNGTKLNTGVTDIRPEDAKFASNRALTAYGAFMTGRGFTGVGYQGTSSTPWLGVPIVSSQSSAQANPVDYAFVPGDKDPITGASTRPYAEAEVGAAPVMVVVNVSNTSAGHMGDPGLALTNVNKYVLAQTLLGKVGHVRDLAAVSNYPSDAALHVWIREPLSGTYNTMDFNVPNANNIAGDYAQGSGRVTGMEAGIVTTNTSCTSKPCTVESGNPLYHLIVPAVGSANGSTSGRVIGSGEMISTTNSVADSIGFSFWGFSSFASSKAGNLKYLSVDGVDPLYSDASVNPNGPGVLPQCPSTPCILPFTNIKNGSYPIWSKLRLVYDPTDSTNIATNLVALVQTASNTYYTDLVPATTLNVFRSHFAQVVTTSGGAYPGNNGIAPGIPETGGDMGGFVITKQDEDDFYTDSGGNQQVNLKN